MDADPESKLSPILAEAELTDAEAAVMLGAIRGATAGDTEFDVKILQVRTAPGVVQVRSRQLANTVLNWRKCIVDLGLAAGGALASGSALGAAVALGRMFKVISEGSNIELGELEARAVLELWRDPADARPFPDADLRAALNVNEEAFERAMMRLQTIGVVTRSEPDGGLVRTETIVFM